MDGPMTRAIRAIRAIFSTLLGNCQPSLRGGLKHGTYGTYATFLGGCGAMAKVRCSPPAEGTAIIAAPFAHRFACSSAQSPKGQARNLHTRTAQLASEAECPNVHHDLMANCTTVQIDGTSQQGSKGIRDDAAQDDYGAPTWLSARNHVVDQWPAVHSSRFEADERGLRRVNYPTPVIGGDR